MTTHYSAIDTPTPLAPRGAAASRTAFIAVVALWGVLAAMFVAVAIVGKSASPERAKPLGLATIAFAAFAVVATGVIARVYGKSNVFSRNVSAMTWGMSILFTAIILLVLGLIAGYLVYVGLSHLNVAFFTQLPIPEGMAGYPGGMLNGLVGTAILIGLASVVGIPVGMMAGVYLSEYDTNSWLAAPVRFISDVLAGVPSIVVGILGYELLVRPVGRHNGWAGAMALAFIMIPIIARTTEEMLRLVPNSYREASIALGASKARTILSVVIPSATGSVVTGVMLAIARVAGETAPLLFTASMSRFLTTDPSEPFPSLTVLVFEYTKSHLAEQRHMASAGILVLITLIFLLNIAIRFTTRERRA